jgi:pimeloyl-ACP methyl ester carboxylesterase
MSNLYTWNNYRCSYAVHTAPNAKVNSEVPLLLVHPIGVGLSRHFWERFCSEWFKTGGSNSIYNPDLLGCGDSEKPRIAYSPNDWAEQLQYFLQTEIQKPVILVVQGALLPVAIALIHLQKEPNLIKGLVLSGPPSWSLITKPTSTLRQKLLWNLFFDSPVGAAFYRYARTPQFLRSFSIRQLFDSVEDVDSQWIDMLLAGAADPDSRYAVFSFLAGFWRQNYADAIANITQPTLVVMGETASSISKTGKGETPDQRSCNYLQYLHAGEGIKVTGRNVLPYESTADFVSAIAPFVKRLS